MKVICQWFVNILISVDQFFNSVLCGDPDETISSRIGKLKVANEGTIPWSSPLAKCVDWCLDKVDPGHSVDAIEPHAGRDAILKNPEWRKK